MSIKVMTEVWEYAPCMGTDLLVLLALADSANDERRCWPGLRSIAKKGRIQFRQCIKVVQDLELQGFIEIEHRKDERRNNLSNHYYIRKVDDWLLLWAYEINNPSVPQNTTPSATGNTRVVSQGTLGVMQPDRENVSEPSYETKIEPLKNPIHASSDAETSKPRPKRHYFEAIAKGVFEISDFKGLSPASLKRIGLLEKSAKLAITSHFPQISDEQGALLISKYCAAEKFKPNLKGQSQFELGLSAYLEKNKPHIPNFLAQQSPPTPQDEPTEFVDPEKVKAMLAEVQAKLNGNEKRVIA